MDDKRPTMAGHSFCIDKLILSNSRVSARRLLTSPNFLRTSTSDEPHAAQKKSEQKESLGPSQEALAAYIKGR
jgi:hypothetical protein